MNTKYLDPIQYVLMIFCLLQLCLQTSCTTVKKNALQDLPENVYRISSKSDRSFLPVNNSDSQRVIKKIEVYTDEDSMYFIVPNTTVKSVLRLNEHTTRPLVLFSQGFDFDVFTTPFKFRPAINGLPQQLNTNFNGSFYFGYRTDRFSVQRKASRYGISRDHFTRTGLGVGAFVGVGSAFINPLSMRNTIDYEYDAVAIDYGIAVLLGLRNFNTGFSVGFDFLTDKNRKEWVYQHKPWMGIFIGLNLN